MLKRTCHPRRKNHFTLKTISSSQAENQLNQVDLSYLKFKIIRSICKTSLSPKKLAMMKLLRRKSKKRKSINSLSNRLKLLCLCLKLKWKKQKRAPKILTETIKRSRKFWNQYRRKNLKDLKELWAYLITNTFSKDATKTLSKWQSAHTPNQFTWDHLNS